MRPALDDATSRGVAVVRWIPTRRRPTRRPLVPHDLALVLAGYPMLDRRTSVAPRAAATKLRVELLQHVRRDLADCDVAQHGLDVPAGVRLISGERVRFGLMHL